MSKSHKKTTFNIPKIVDRINEFYSDNLEEYDLREILAKVFSEKHDFEDLPDVLTVDYPVEGYTKKDGTKVKAHTRGESSLLSNFNQTNLRQLKFVAKKSGVQGYSKLKKEELITKILEHSKKILKTGEFGNKDSWEYNPKKEESFEDWDESYLEEEGSYDIPSRFKDSIIHKGLEFYLYRGFPFDPSLKPIKRGFPHWYNEYIGFEDQLIDKAERDDDYFLLFQMDGWQIAYRSKEGTRKGRSLDFITYNSLIFPTGHYVRTTKDGTIKTLESFRNGEFSLDIGEALQLIGDFIHDAAQVGRPPTIHQRGLKAGTPSAAVSGAKRTKVGQTLLKQLGTKAFEVGMPTAVTSATPFSMVNIESGVIVRGEVVSELVEGIKQLTPVSSSNVKGVGQFKNELLVQFLPSKLTPQRTYRYTFETPEGAEEAYGSLVSTGSPGRWVWEYLRGHIKGEAVSASKLGSSLKPPGKGLPTIGGTSASLVPYGIATRVPVSRVAGFDKMAKLLKLEESNPTLFPETGSRVEGLLGTRKLFRDQTLAWVDPRIAPRVTAIADIKKEFAALGMKTPKLPGLDFVYVGNLNDLTEDYKVKGYYSMRGKTPKRTFTRRHTRDEGKTIADIPRLTSEEVQIAHIISIRKKRLKEIPIWSKLKDLRERLEENLKEIREAEKKRDYPKVNELNAERQFIREQLEIPQRKQNEQLIQSYEDSIEWHEEHLKRLEKERLESAFPDEIGAIIESMQEERAMIRMAKRNIYEVRERLKNVERFESKLFDTHNDLDLQYGFDEPLDDKLKVAKGIIYKEPFSYGWKIELINREFKNLPKNLRDSCSQIRIFEIANDDPSYGSLEGCGGFYDPRERTITVGLRNSTTERIYSPGFVKEATVHEAAHALDYAKLHWNEKFKNEDFYAQNLNRLRNRGEYAAKNKTEFFAEGYTNLYIENHAWFRGLTKGTKGFFKNIIQKYDFILDFIMNDLNEKINGIKFSYENSDGKWIFGFYRVPEEISYEEAEIMVNEGKAQYENVDKYLEPIEIELSEVEP